MDDLPRNMQGCIHYRTVLPKIFSETFIPPREHPPERMTHIVVHRKIILK
jgi:hypothetical protein